jgi:hypothetical protein
MYVDLTVKITETTPKCTIINNLIMRWTRMPTCNTR